jgi:hypothetical protein
MKYSENDAGKQAELEAPPKGGSSKTRTRTHLPMRLPRLRYRNSLRKNRLRAPLAQNYAERKADSSNPCFRLSSFSIHSTKNT